ncbi:MAG: 2-phospho-L-lactate guanylyltransferase [Pseudomonadales bacterium]|jgi:2-phospho-L-lactate guanylyltransferase|nr:2-phospho-L-lactate guanylyltransferase [Pseudomonadales bacterium]
MTNLSTWAVVPVKSFAEAKSRLSDFLDSSTRRNLALAMLEDALVTLSAIEPIDRVLIVSSEPQAAELADLYGAVILREPVDTDVNASLDTGLNRAIKHAANFLLQQSVERMLVLPADIPLMNPEDVRALTAQSIATDDKSQNLALVSDQKADGTNALLVSPPNLIQFSYGQHSYQRHLQQGKQLNANLSLPNLPSFCLDIDTPDDLHSLLLNQHKLRADCRTLQWLNHNFSKGVLNPSFDAVGLKEQRL